MKIKEDHLIVIRAIKKRPVESLLLILGIALGIGATASGISIVFSTGAEAKKLLAETRYREIVVRTRENSRQMELPAEEVRQGNATILTVSDLGAAANVPDVEYAYVANNRRLFFGDPRSRWNQERNNSQGSTSTNTGTSPGAFQGGPGGAPDGPPPGENMIIREGGDPFQREPLPVLEGPKPVIEELSGMEVSPSFFPAYGLNAAKGSLFTDSDMRNRARLLILGSEIAGKLFEDGESLGRQVQDRRQIYTISGILLPTGTTLDKQGFILTVIPDSEGGESWNRFMNWNTVLRFSVKDSSRLDQAKAQLMSWFEQAYGIGSVSVSIPKEEADELVERNTRLVTIILILAMSGLLIAAVNVSNILYSRAIRKRKSIGILKALGATRQKIFGMFFVEALIIGIGGALSGTGVAVLLANTMRSSLGIGGYSIGILGLGILLSWGTTLLLTDIPALQVAKIPASEAIRYE